MCSPLESQIDIEFTAFFLYWKMRWANCDTRALSHSIRRTAETVASQSTVHDVASSHSRTNDEAIRMQEDKWYENESMLDAVRGCQIIH